MPTDLEALAKEFEDNSGRPLNYADNDYDRFSAEECQQIATALRLLALLEKRRKSSAYAAHYLKLAEKK